MKKLITLLVAGSMAFSLSACNAGDNKRVAEEPEQAIEETVPPVEDSVGSDSVLGGWRLCESPVVTDEIRDVVEKGTAGLVGATYKPVAFVASQLVAGTNYCILCEVTPVVPDPVPTYALTVFYEDLDDNVQLTSVVDANQALAYAGALDALPGGWSVPETPVLTDEARNALGKATEGLEGATYTPIALLGTQVVAGMNYAILCQVTDATENPAPKYCIVEVYEDPQHNAVITNTVDFAG